MTGEREGAPHTWPRVLLGLGSSLAPRDRHLLRAVRLLTLERGLTVEAASWTYRTPPLGRARGHFLNAAVRLRTALSPLHLLDRVQEIERRVGRRPTARWSDRVVDIDLLVMEGVLSDDVRLRLPHPGLRSRDFAWEPACEVAQDLVLTRGGPPLVELSPPAPRGLVRTRLCLQSLVPRVLAPGVREE